MKVEFELAKLSPTEATAIAALLITQFGNDLFTKLMGSTTPAPTTVTNVVNHGQAEAPVEDLKSMITDTTVAVVDDNAERDSRGYAWDKRIHSGSKAKIADGTWKMFRGVSDDLVKQVEAEQDAQRGATPAPAATTAAPPPPPTTETKAPPPPPPSETVIQAAAASAVAQASEKPFLIGMKKVTALQKAGLLDDATKGAFLAEAGLESLAKGATNDEAMTAFIDLLDETFGEAAAV